MVELMVEKLWVALFGGWNGCSWKRKKEEEEKSAEFGQKCWFLADFGPEFLLPQIIKSDSIYRL